MRETLEQLGEAGVKRVARGAQRAEALRFREFRPMMLEFGEVFDARRESKAAHRAAQVVQFALGCLAGEVRGIDFQLRQARRDILSQKARGPPVALLFLRTAMGEPLVHHMWIQDRRSRWHAAIQAIV